MKHASLMGNSKQTPEQDGVKMARATVSRQHNVEQFCAVKTA
jgi:hypothetical protein